MAMRPDIDTSKMNKAVIEAVQGLMKPLPAPVSHGEFNRRMFVEAFLLKAGSGVGIEPEDIMEYGGLTKREFDTILREYLAKGVIVKDNNLFGVEMYKLNMET